MPIDEQACRRADFCGGIPVKLADGQMWTLPRVRRRYVSAPDHPDGFRVVIAGLGPDYAALADAAYAAETPKDVIRTELALARALLLRNYTLDEEQLAELIQFEYGADPDPDCAAMRAAFLDVAGGLVPAPKASPATST